MIRARRAALALLSLLFVAPHLAAQQSPPEWHEIGKGDVRVRFIPPDSLEAERVLALLLAQASLPGLPAGVPAQAIAYLAPDEDTFLALTGGVPHWGAGVAIPDERALILPAYASRRSAPGSLTPVLRHEWAHLGLHEYLPGLQIPRWFDEGYALLAEGGFDASEGWRLRLLIALDRTPPLDSLALDFPRDQASAEAAYLLSGSAVAYLVEESGERGLRLMLQRWRAEGSFERALAGTYGVRSDQLEEDWRKWVKRRFGWLLVLSHSAVVWGALALGLMGLTVLRRRRNREKMAWLRATEPADAPAYWDEGEAPARPPDGPPDDPPDPTEERRE